MKNELQLFTNEIFGNVRAVNINDEAWFVGKDVVESLGYEINKTTSYTKYINRFVDEEDTLKMKNSDLELFKMEDAGRKGETFVNEYAIIALVLQSPLPQAKQFRRWVTHEIIPSVLTTGKYSISEKVKPKTQEELAKDSIFGLVYNKIEDTDKRLEAVQHISDYSIIVGKSEVCDDGTITIPMVKKIVVKHYGDILMNYNIFLSEQFCEFSRFLLQQHYLVTKRFPRKIGVGLEKRKAYQPTELFEETFVKQGMAVARVIDERGKVEVTYTKDIEKYIISDTFKFEFFKYLGVDLVETSVAI